MNIVLTLSCFLIILVILASSVYSLRVVMLQVKEALNVIGHHLTEVTTRKDALSHDSLRLQACERLTLMLERIAIHNLLLRYNLQEGQSAQSVTANLLLSIREEYEYNVTQQIYVSEALWMVVLQARDNVSQLIMRASEGAQTGQQVIERLRVMSSRQTEDAIALAQAAVRQEATRVLR